MTFRGHRPSGKTSWPIVLVAGAEKVGKSYLVAEFTGSPLIGHSYWFEFGEHTAEEYGEVPGANYTIGDYDGSFNDLCRNVREAIAEPRIDGKPNCIVIDSVTVIWETLSTEAQLIANRRKKADLDAESKITSDIWNLVTERWKKLVRILKTHDGPVVLLARLEVVAVMDDKGQPTKDKTQKVKAQKSLPYDVDAIVQMPEYRRYQLTGVRSLRLQMPVGETFDMPPDFTLDALMRNLGHAEIAPVQRAVVEPVASADDAIAEANGGEVPDRPMTRPARGVQDDEWTTPGPPKADRRQVDRIISGLGSVRGIEDETGGMAAIRELAGRPVQNPYDLTPDEAAGILAALAAEHEAKQAAQKLTDKQRTAIQAHYGNTERDERLEDIERRIGRQVDSTNDLTVAEASRLLDSFKTGEIAARTPEPIGATV